MAADRPLASHVHPYHDGMQRPGTTQMAVMEVAYWPHCARAAHPCSGRMQTPEMESSSAGFVEHAQREKMGGSASAFVRHAGSSSTKGCSFRAALIMLRASP